jgi:glucose/mannose transport system substrate-binding protein
MGDWAKGEWINAGKVPGTDVLCFRYPGTQGAVTFNSDAFGMMAISEEKQDAQFKLAAAIMDPAFQESFNLKKGSIPARTDVPDTNFDACGKKAIADAKEATANNALMGSLAHGHAAPEAVKGAVYDVVTEFFNSDMSSADAAKKLSAAVANAK